MIINTDNIRWPARVRIPMDAEDERFNDGVDLTIDAVMNEMIGKPTCKDCTHGRLDKGTRHYMCKRHGLIEHDGDWYCADAAWRDDDG